MTDNNNIWRQMLSGQRYNALDPYLVERLAVTRAQIWEFNNLHPDRVDEAKSIIRNLFGSTGENFQINAPFRCDYGENISIGDRFFANFNLTILDEAKVTIGDYVFIGPNVSIYTACHPLDTQERNIGVEWAEPVTIGNNVWIGGSVTILPGVTIGDNVVIGAGSVVVKDVPSDTVAVGNPARVVKTLK